MKAFRRPLPGKRRRTIASAQTIPKTVFTGTAIAVMISVSLNAWIVSGCRERVPGGREAVLERPPEDDRERPDEDRPPGSRARRRGARARAYARSCLVAKWRIAPIESSVTNEIASSTTATAAAPAESPLSMRPKM